MNISRALGAIGKDLENNLRMLRLDPMKPIALSTAIDLLNDTKPVYHVTLWEVWIGWNTNGGV